MMVKVWCNLKEEEERRITHWKMNELLCKAWCNIVLDATVGAYQSKETYWVRIKEF
jgi:hypothetical protein